MSSSRVASGDPETSYVARLLARGEDAILKKIGEEATETVMAAKDGSPDRIIAETADLWFHCLIMLAHYRLRPEQVLAELRTPRRHLGNRGKGARKAQRARHEDRQRRRSMTASCLFCRIARGEVPSRKAYEDDEVIAFHDINPAAPVHLLMVPKVHVDSLVDDRPGARGVVG